MSNLKTGRSFDMRLLFKSSTEKNKNLVQVKSV